jgi:hypothetical protein
MAIEAAERVRRRPPCGRYRLTTEAMVRECFKNQFHEMEDDCTEKVRDNIYFSVFIWFFA